MAIRPMLKILTYIPEGSRPPAQKGCIFGKLETV